MSYYNPQQYGPNGTNPSQTGQQNQQYTQPMPSQQQQHPGMLSGVVAGTGFRSMAAAISRRNDRGDDSGSDDNVFEGVENLGRRNQQRGNGRSRSRGHVSSVGGRAQSTTRSAYSSRHSRRSRSPSYASSVDSRPTRTSRGTRSVHSRSTYVSRRTFTNRSISTYTDDSDSSSQTSYSTASRTHTTLSSRSYTKSHTTTATTLTHQTRSAILTQQDGRSTAHSVLPTMPVVAKSGSFALPTQYNEYSRPRIQSTASEHGADASIGHGSDSGSSRSRTPVKKVDAGKLAIASVLESTAAGGFDCLLEDPSKQPTKKNKRTTSAKRRAASSRRSLQPSATASARRATSKSVDRQSSVTSRTDDTKSVLERKEQAAEYRLNIVMLQRFCMEFSAPYNFSTADSDAFAQQQELDAAGIHSSIPTFESTGVPVNTKNSVNAALMATIDRGVQFVMVHGPKYPSEMVRALLWRVEQSSTGPHDRLGAWKMLDGALRCLHHKQAAYLKQEQTFKVRESAVQQERHNYGQSRGADEDDNTRLEKDSQFYAAANATMRTIDAERSAARSSVRWVKVMLSEFASLIPYLILFCWGGDRGSAAAASSRKKNAKPVRNSTRFARSAHSGSSAGAIASNASDDTVHLAAADELAVLKGRVMDFVAGRIHGDGTMTERGQKHHFTLLMHHHTLDTQAASTAAPRNNITTQSRFAVGNGVHLTTSKAKAVITEQEIFVINQQIFAEYDTILRGWHALFASDMYYISYQHLRRAVADYAALLTDHEAAVGGKGANGTTKHRNGSELYHFALKAANLKQNATDTKRMSVYTRQREAFESFILPPARMSDALWRFRRNEPRPSLVASVLQQYGFPIFKLPTPLEASSAPLYDDSRLVTRNAADPEPIFAFPKSAEEVSAYIGHPVNDRLQGWIAKAAECGGGCLACDSWGHTFNTCPYRPSRFVPLNRQIVAVMTASEAVDVLKTTASRSINDRSAITTTLNALAGGGAMNSIDRAGTFDATRPDIVAGGSDKQDQARKQLILDVLDVAVERAASSIEMDTQLNALDVILRQSSTGRERQALLLLATYRLQPSKMLQFTKGASTSNDSRKTKRKMMGVMDFAKGGRTVAAEKLLAYLSQEHRFYECGRLRCAFETLYYRYLCIPHNDAPLLAMLQKDVALIRENRCFVDVLGDDEAPLQSRLYAVAAKSPIEAAVIRVKRLAHLLDPCTLELSPCCSGAGAEAVRAYNSQQGVREPFEATEPWDWFVARQVLKSERLVSQHDGLTPVTDGEQQSRYQRSDELIDSLNKLADAHERRADGGRIASSRLRLVIHVIRQAGFCTSCNRFGHTRRTCAELARTLIQTSLTSEIKIRLGIRSLTTARLAVSAMADETRKLLVRRQRVRDELQKADLERDLRTLSELIALLGGQQDLIQKGKGRFGQRATQLPPSVVLVSRRVGGVRSGQIDLGSTAVSPALPPSLGQAITAIVNQTGLSLAELRFCPDECLALFHTTAHHQLTPHISAFRDKLFPNLIITSSQFEDDAFEERATQDRIASATVTHDLSSQTLAQLSNPSAKRRPRAYSLPADHFFQLALRFDGTARLTSNTVVTDGLQRALNAQQLCRDRYLDLAAYLMKTTGSGSVDSEGQADYETVYSLLLPTSYEAKEVRQRLLARGKALQDELFRRINSRAPNVNPATLDQRPYGLMYELERDYFLRNLSSDSDKAAYTFYAALLCRNNMVARLRLYSQQRALPLPQQSQVQPLVLGGAPIRATSQVRANSQNPGALSSQNTYAAPSTSQFGLAGPSPSLLQGASTANIGASSLAFRGRLSTGLLYSQDITASQLVSAAPAATEMQGLNNDSAVLESPDYNAARARSNASTQEEVGQKHARSNDSERVVVDQPLDGEPQTQKLRPESA